MRVTLPDSQYTTQKRVSEFFESALARLNAIPGVRSAATINLLPIQQYGYNSGIEVPGLPKPSHLMGMVFGQSAAVLASGLLFGLGGVYVVTRVLPNVLYGVHEVDAASLAASIGVLAAAALLALFVPAWRAMRIDPILTLRQD
jgi:hypothetical protein